MLIKLKPDQGDKCIGGRFLPHAQLPDLMELLTLFFIALGLSMDALAVSVSNGMCSKGMNRGQAVKTAVTFGGFQAAMPIAGYYAGRTFSQAIYFLDHWIALILLGIIGGKMIISAVSEMRHPESCRTRSQITWGTLIIQGIATSIDAFTIGISFALFQVNIVVAALFIGLVTFVCCIPGAYLGRKFGSMIQQRAEIIGGLILIIMGLKIFLEHMLGGG
jgi:putative Mn2+ efflux pump MntP